MEFDNILIMRSTYHGLKWWIIWNLVAQRTKHEHDNSLFMRDVIKEKHVAVFEL